MNTSKANTNKPWLSPEYDIPVLENEEMWSQQVIDETAGYIWLEIDREENDKEKETKRFSTD
jgi:hypothetical protein